jgi:hypothetical protein
MCTYRHTWVQFFNPAHGRFAPYVPGNHNLRLSAHFFNFTLFDTPLPADLHLQTDKLL